MQNDPMPLAALLEQGTCCGAGCVNCPFLTSEGQRHIAGTTLVDEPWVKAKATNPQLTYKQWDKNNHA